MNLLSLLGKRKRDNTSFRGYKDNPELYDELGEKGIGFKEMGPIASWLMDKGNYGSVVLGNTVFTPSSQFDDDPWMAYDSNVPYENVGTAIAYEEIPHVKQWRDKGLIGMLGHGIADFGKEMISGIVDPDVKLMDKINPLAIQKRLYDDHQSYEGFHQDEGQKRDYINAILGEGSYKQYRGWPYDEGPGTGGENLPQFNPEYADFSTDPSGSGWTMPGSDEALLTSYRIPVEHKKSLYGL